MDNIDASGFTRNWHLTHIRYGCTMSAKGGLSPAAGANAPCDMPVVETNGEAWRGGTGRLSSTSPFLQGDMEANMAEGQVIHFRIPDLVRDRMDAEAERLGIRPTEVARVVLSAGLAKLQAMEAEPDEA